MDLVHKQDVVLVEIGEQSRQIPRLLNGGAGGNAHVDSHLVGDDAGQGGLAQTRGAVEQNVVQGLVPHLSRLDEYLQIALGLLLADVLPEGLGPQGVLSLILPGEGGGHQRLQLLILIFRSGKVDCHGFTS